MADDLGERWRRESAAYCAAIAEYVREGERTGWSGKEKQPTDGRAPMAPAVLEEVRAANERLHTAKTEGERRAILDALRSAFPPAHEPFFEHVKRGGRYVGPVTSIGGGRFVVRVGPPWEAGETFVVSTDGFERLPADAASGRSPNRRFVARTGVDGIEVREGWDGAVVVRLPWPAEPFTDARPHVEALTVMDEGLRALLVTGQGTWMLAESGATLLDPTPERVAQQAAWHAEDVAKTTTSSKPPGPFRVRIDMAHGTVSPDGALLAVGNQDGPHRVLDARTLEVVASIGHASEYPCHAAFTADGTTLALSSCHFYSGATLGVATSTVRGRNDPPYAPVPDLPRLDEGMRVYAGAAIGHDLFLGDAHGYVRERAPGGSKREHFCGSTVSGMDADVAAGLIAVGTYAGVLHLLSVTGDAGPYVIGKAPLRELRRHVFWSSTEPLSW